MNVLILLTKYVALFCAILIVMTFPLFVLLLLSRSMPFPL